MKLKLSIFGYGWFLKFTGKKNYFADKLTESFPQRNHGIGNNVWSTEHYQLTTGSGWHCFKEKFLSLRKSIFLNEKAQS